MGVSWELLELKKLDFRRNTENVAGNSGTVFLAHVVGRPWNSQNTFFGSEGKFFDVKNRD